MDSSLPPNYDNTDASMRRKVAGFIREMRCDDYRFLTIKERNQAIKSHAKSYAPATVRTKSRR